MNESDYKKLIDKSAKKLLACLRAGGLPNIIIKEEGIRNVGTADIRVPKPPKDGEPK